MADAGTRADRAITQKPLPAHPPQTFGLGWGNDRNEASSAIAVDLGEGPLGSIASVRARRKRVRPRPMNPTLSILISVSEGSKPAAEWLMPGADRGRLRSTRIKRLV